MNFNFRGTKMRHTKHYSFLLLAMSAALVAGCAPQGHDLPVLSENSVYESYLLGPGDKLQIVLYGANQVTTDRPGMSGDGNGQYIVSETGFVDAPLIGEMHVSGLTVDQLKQELTKKLAAGYLNHPQVGVEIASYRPFFIVGEVNHPGSYPCTARSRMLSAIAMAGGFTYRANEDFVVVERRQGDKIVTGRVGPDSVILPDDVIRVTQRYY